MDDQLEEARNVEPGWYPESNFTNPHPNCPHPEHWHTYDIQGTEAEVIEMVGGMIRGLQPEVCLETGTSRGYMAREIGRALEANGHGHLYTYEPVPRTATEAHVTTVTVSQWVTIYTKPSMTPWAHGEIDFAWFDSLIPLRWSEFDYYHQFMHRRTIVGFHDTAVHFGSWANQIKGDDRLHWFELPTPRGAIIGRVVA